MSLSLAQKRTLRALFHTSHAMSLLCHGDKGALGTECAETQLRLAGTSQGLPDIVLDSVCRDSWGGLSESTALSKAERLMAHKWDRWGDVEPIASGFSGEGDESGVSWVLYTRAAWDDGLVSVDERGSYRGAGRGFQDPAQVTIGRTRVLVKQRTGLDI